MPFAKDIVAIITTIPNDSMRFWIVYNNYKCCMPMNTTRSRRERGGGTLNVFLAHPMVEQYSMYALC